MNKYFIPSAILALTLVFSACGQKEPSEPLDFTPAEASELKLAAASNACIKSEIDTLIYHSIQSGPITKLELSQIKNRCASITANNEAAKKQRDGYLKAD